MSSSRELQMLLMDYKNIKKNAKPQFKPVHDFLIENKVRSRFFNPALTIQSKSTGISESNFKNKINKAIAFLKENAIDFYHVVVAKQPKIVAIDDDYAQATPADNLIEIGPRYYLDNIFSLASTLVHEAIHLIRSGLAGGQIGELEAYYYELELLNLLLQKVNSENDKKEITDIINTLSKARGLHNNYHYKI